MFKKLFSKFKKNKIGKIRAIQSGKVINISEISDVMFAEKILGDGVALIPKSNDIYSPVSGKIDVIANTLHAYGIKTNDGLDVLVHVGLETIELKGKGFKPKVKVGDRVKVGDLLLTVDIDLLKDEGYEIITPVIITNMDDIEEIKTYTGEATEKETVIIKYIKK
ncbi:PTS sugar transporter subunit IIA [Miniphocaeibacter massiliensis]|uniref:PTS sugar transporter subunit IIA n=1 Tax=Miniphocaeibacter massiliensis TaxID=2041841 RepID=UPI000C1C19CF|nr:PTS glucose transporter subunit IIA [Miniphocaeibacter massiliensis]